MRELHEIAVYLQSKSTLWSPTTLSTTRGKLLAIAKLGVVEPKKIFDRLKELQLGLYSIKQYMILWSGFEFWKLERSPTKLWMQQHKFVFANCYHEKTKKLSQSEVDELLRSLRKRPELWNLVYLMAYCGLRRSEALSACWSDLDGDHLKVVGKGGKARRVPIHASRLKRLRHKRIGGAAVGFKNLTVKLKNSPINCSPHDFRAFYATLLYENGQDLKAIKDFLGHRSIETTDRYIRNDFEKASKEVLKILNK